MTKKYTILEEKLQQEMNLLNQAPRDMQDKAFRLRKKEVCKILREVRQVRRDLVHGQKLFGRVA